MPSPPLPSAPPTEPITTNEGLSRLHPAVVRRGRCLAGVEVGRLSYAEATAWLGDDAAGVPTGGATLAELYALRCAGRGGAGRDDRRLPVKPIRPGGPPPARVPGLLGCQA